MKTILAAICVLALAACNSKTDSIGGNPSELSKETSPIMLEDAANNAITWAGLTASSMLRVKEIRGKLKTERSPGPAQLLSVDLLEAMKTEDEEREKLEEFRVKLKKADTAITIKYLAALKRYEDALEAAGVQHLRDVTDGDWRARQAEWHRLRYANLNDVMREFGEVEINGNGNR